MRHATVITDAGRAGMGPRSPERATTAHANGTIGWCRSYRRPILFRSRLHTIKAAARLHALLHASARRSWHRFVRRKLLEQVATYAYETPAIVETFEALEILGSAEGFEVYTIGCGSSCAAISIAR
jgi:hypothetical protein